MNQEYIKYREALKTISETESGKIVGEYLKSVYVDVQALRESSEITHYFLGQKELVQGLLSEAVSEIPNFNEDVS